jgi:hypothetical protein
MKTQITHKVVLNHSKKSITIKAYENGKLQTTYKDDFATSEIMEAAEDWTEADILNYLKTSASYYKVK